MSLAGFPRPTLLTIGATEIVWVRSSWTCCMSVQRLLWYVYIYEIFSIQTLNLRSIKQYLFVKYFFLIQIVTNFWGNCEYARFLSRWNLGEVYIYEIDFIALYTPRICEVSSNTCFSSISSSVMMWQISGEIVYRKVLI